jgi:hypothetical protein
MARSRAQSGGSEAPCRVHRASRTQEGGCPARFHTHYTHHSLTSSALRVSEESCSYRVSLELVKTPWGFVHTPTRCLAACWHAWYAGRKWERGVFPGAGAEAGSQSRRLCSCGRARPARRSVGKIPSTSRIRSGGASDRKPTAAAWWPGCTAQVCSGCIFDNFHSPRAPSARRSLARHHRSEGIDAKEACAGRAWDGFDRNEDSQGAGPNVWRLGPLCFGPLAARQQHRQTRNGPAHTYTPTVALRWMSASCYSV